MQKLWQSIYWKILSCGCFAGINVVVRFMSGGSPIFVSKPLPIYSIMFFQHMIGMLIISAWMWSANELHFDDFRTTKPWLHFLRVVTAAIGIGLFYLSLKYIPVTQAVALSITTPIITTIGAVVFLKETFNLPRKLAVFASIAGGILVARPDQAILQPGIPTWYVLLPVLAAFAFAFDKLLTRKLLALNEKPRTLAWYLLAFIAPFSLLPVLHYGWVSPEMQHWPWLCLLGLLGACAHYTFNKAYALAEVTVLLPFGAARLLLGGLFSYLAFYEIPKTVDLWFGMGIIIFSTILLSAETKFFIRPKHLILDTKV